MTFKNIYDILELKKENIMDRKQARKITKRARQRQRIALQLKELRTLRHRKEKWIFDGIFCLRNIGKNYPKL